MSYSPTKYSFGVPSIVIWISHILIGISLFYIGYQFSIQKYSKNYSLFLIILGSLAVSYHFHLLVSSYLGWK